MYFSFRALSAAGAVLVVTACGTNPPPVVSASPSAGSASPSASASVTPSGTDTGTPSTTVSPSAPAANAVVLQPKGIDGADFGTPEDDVEAVLTAKSGKPDDSFSGPVCELNDATPYGRQLVYGGAVFLFQSKRNGNRNAARTFTSWVVNMEQPLKPSMRLADGYPVDTTFAKLKREFPRGKLTSVALGETAVYIFRTPSGIWYRGDDNKTPTDIGAGSMGTCE